MAIKRLKTETDLKMKRIAERQNVMESFRSKSFVDPASSKQTEKLQMIKKKK
jgi:hypothetical protein